MKKVVNLTLCLISILIVTVSVTCVLCERFDAEPRYALDFAGGSLQGLERRTVYYDYRTIDEYVNPYKAPSFVANYSNSCVVDAGGNALAYYDRIYDDLVPNYSYTTVWGKFTYGAQNDGINAMFSDLYTLMETDSRGTTVPGFKTGMQKYVSNHNHTVNITGATGTYCNLNMDYLKAQLKQEKMAIVFLSDFSISSFDDIHIRNGYDEITHYVYDGNHAMLIYGYYDIYYYRSNGTLIQRDTYLYASTGYGGADLGWLNINYFCGVNDAYIIEVT